MKPSYRIPLAILLICSAFLLSSCSERTNRLWLESPGWSRAQVVGETSLEKPGVMTLDEDGNIYTFTTRLEDNGYHPVVIALNQLGEITWKRGLGILLVNLKSAQILWDGENLVLFWLDDNGLYTTQIDRQGKLLKEPTHLSQGKKVDSFTTAIAPNNSIAVWFGGNWREPGISMLTLDNPSGESVSIDTEGLFPAIQFDQEGTLHASWLTYPEGPNKPNINYANYPGGFFVPGQESVIADIAVRSDSRLSGPWLGLDSTNIYIFWNEVIRSGRRINEGSPKYIYFKIGDPADISEAKTILVPNTKKLNYSGSAGTKLISGERVLPGNGPYTLISPDEIVVNPTSCGEIALALRVHVPDQRGNLVSQVGMFYLKDGESTGYQLLSNTLKASISPAVITDQVGHVYISWLERIQGSGFTLFFASTAPDINKTYSPITSSDVSLMLGETVFGLLKGAAFALLYAPLWLIIPGVLIALTSRFRRDSDDPFSRFTISSLVLAMVIYWWVKLFTLNSVNNFIPFSIWIPVIPHWLELPLKLGVPIIGTGIGLKVASHFALRDGVISALKFFIIYGGIDCLFTLAVYGEFLFTK